MSKLLDVPEICERWQCGQTFARDLLRRGPVPVIRIGKLVRVRESDILAYEQSQAQQPRTDPTGPGVLAPTTSDAVSTTK